RFLLPATPPGRSREVRVSTRKSDPAATRQEPRMPDEMDTPVLDTLAVMTAASLENCRLPERELMLVRAAALVATGAPAASYLLTMGAAVDAGITMDDVQDVL